MTLTNSSIYEKIENKGAQDAAEINRIGQEKAKGIADAILEDAKREADQVISRAVKRNDDIVRTKATQLEQSARQRSLLKKKDIINRIFAQAQEKLKNLTDEDFSTLVVKMIQSDELHGNEVLKVALEDQNRYIRLFSSGKLIDNNYLLDKLNYLLNSTRYQLKLSKEPANVDGGFVIIGDNYDIDHSYRTMFDAIKEQFESQIAKVLFDGE